MHSIQDVIILSSDYLKDKGVKNFRRIAEEALSLSLNMSRLDLYLNFDKPLLENELSLCRKMLIRLATGEPYQYIQGFVSFYDCVIEVNQKVLIPRNETEILVDNIIKSLKIEKSILDLCTGSGCIAIAIKKNFPQIEMYALDISNDALDVAKRNAKKNNAHVHFIKADFLNGFDRRVDVIVCNPPYISECEYRDLDQSVVGFEPKLALVAPDDGLYFYNKLAREGKMYLNHQGSIYLEIGHLQGDLVKDIFQSQGWLSCQVIKDYSSNDRFFKAISP
jgi:release factor glutamine methyltransferase